MWADIRAAISFLTIIPLGYSQNRLPGWSFAWYPLVGLLIGGCLTLTAYWSPFAPNITAGLTLIVWVILTGGLHLDGFGDSCDGLLATVSAERRLAIMKDPRAGSWAVIGLVLLLLGKWSAIPAVPPLMLMVPPIIGRWIMVIAAYAFPYARSSGLGAYFREGLGARQVITATVITLVSTALITQQIRPTVTVFVIASGVVVIIGRWAARRLGGGITGDVYGALCELIEWLILVMFTL